MSFIMVSCLDQLALSPRGLGNSATVFRLLISARRGARRTLPCVTIRVLSGEPSPVSTIYMVINVLFPKVPTNAIVMDFLSLIDRTVQIPSPASGASESCLLPSGPLPQYDQSRRIGVNPGPLCSLFLRTTCPAPLMHMQHVQN